MGFDVIAFDAITWRGVERLVIVGGGIVFGYLGFALYRFGVREGKTKVDFQSEWLRLAVGGSGPGLGFACIGAIVHGFSSPCRFRSDVQVSRCCTLRQFGPIRRILAPVIDGRRRPIHATRFADGWPSSGLTETGQSALRPTKFRERARRGLRLGSFLSAYGIRRPTGQQKSLR